MSKAITEIVAGGTIIALDVAFLGGNPVLFSLGAGLVASGVGNLLSKQQQGIAANIRNPISPWNVVYGQAKVGGTIIYMEETGETDKFLHWIYVLACHPCQSLDAVIFDQKRVCLDTNGNSLSFGDSTAVIANQQTVNIVSIMRANNVVTVVMANPMPLPASTAAGPALMSSDTVQIQNVTGDLTLNGQYVINLINPTTFNYICGGNPAIVDNEGSVKTQWPDYGDTIHMEVALGAQGPGNPPFPGLFATDGSGSNGLWTTNHLLQGRTAVWLRLKYGGNTYAPGTPTIGFVVSGKNDIYDPRAGSHGYETNSALCIADFLTQQTWGFKCNYGTDVPVPMLIAAANICDEIVPLADGNTEYRYSCNGSFQLTARRGEILQNLLTSCAGRLTFSGGQYGIFPGAWIGPTGLYGQPIIGGTLTVVTSYIPGIGYGGLAEGATGALGLGAAFKGAQHIFMINGAAFNQQTTMVTLSQSDAAGGLNVLFSIAGSLLGTAAPPAQFLIHDAFATITYANGVSTTFRPTLAEQFPSGAGTISNPNNAIDGDLSTYATITQSLFGGAVTGPILALTGFAGAPGTGSSPGTVPLPFAPLTVAAGPFQWKPKVPIRDLYNGVKATYVSPLNSWQASDMPPYAQDTDHGYPAPAGTTGYYDINLAADGGDRRWYDTQLPFTTSVSMAQRIAKIELLRRRNQQAATFVSNLAMYQVTALDVLSVTLPYIGWNGQLVEVTSHRFTVQKKDDNQMTLGTEIDVQQTDPSIYVWSASEELSPEGYQQAVTSNIQTIAAPAGVTLGNVTTQAGGVSSGQIQVSWTPTTDGYIVNGGQVIAQYSLDGVNWIGLGTFDSSATTAFLPPVSAGQQYYARIAYINAGGVQSPWTVQGPLTATGSTLRRIDDETPGGAEDGVNAIFTLSQIPNPSLSLELYYNGIEQIQGISYTLSGSTITFVAGLIPPNASQGDDLRAWYWY